MFETTKWYCLTDAIKYKIIEKKQIYKFLLGLNKNLYEVWDSILGTKPLPNIQEVNSEVCQEKSRKKVMFGSQISQLVIEGSTLAARGPLNPSNDNQPWKGRTWCDHCQKPGHTKDMCWIKIDKKNIS